MELKSKGFVMRESMQSAEICNPQKYLFTSEGKIYNVY